MRFNRFATSRTAFGLCSAMLFLSVPAAHAQDSGPKMTSTVINFSSRDELKATNAAQILAGRLDLRSGVDELRSAYIEKPGDGLQVQRFHQYFKGLRVSHGSYSVSSKNGNASFAFGKYFQIPAATSIVPSIDLNAAIEIAKSEIRAEKYSWESDPAEFPTGKLELCQNFRADEMTDEVHLAWVFDIHADAPLSGNKMYVDAQTGKVLLADAIIKHTAASGPSLYSGNVNFQTGFVAGLYRMHDSTRGGGIVTYDMGNGMSYNTAPVASSTTTTFGQDPAIDAHWGATMVYDYWKNNQNRLSFDGNDTRLRSYVHYSTAYNNAFWSGGRMVYGDGTGAASGGFNPLTSLDVCAHEIGHGVCEYTAALVYNRESGAMNEGFSDIWGAVVEHYGDPKETDSRAKDMWLIGEELGNTMRSMRQPKLYSQPNTYYGVNWISVLSAQCNNTNDQCGVHYNSGVLNHWFYLLVEGGSGTNDMNNYYKLTGLGVNTAARIAYATELVLNSTANYASARTASINQATTIYGACSKEVEAVTRAWYAVGVGADYNTPCAPQIAFEAGVETSISENVGINACAPSRVVNVPVVMRGSTALSGDSATVTARVIGGNAVAGTDYDLTDSVVTFRVGGGIANAIGITVYDNGYVNASKYLDLKLSITARNSNASLAVVGDSIRVNITENEGTPELGGTDTRQVLTSAGSTLVGMPFSGSAMGSRSQYIYRPFEIAAAGIRPNVPVTSIEFYINGLFTTQPYSNYNLKMGNTTVPNLTTGWVTSGLSTVFSGTHSPVMGWSQITFSTPFVWNGRDNIVLEACFDNGFAAGGNNDRVSVGNGPQFLAAYNTSTTAGGCNLPFVPANLIGQRPLIRLNQDLPGAAVETAVNSTRSWDVPSASQTYFSSASNDKLMVGINSPTDSLGCITATVTAAGNGLEYGKFAHNRYRTRKEYSLTQATPRAQTSFDGTLYFTNEELGNIDPAQARILYTTVSNDYDIGPSNSRIIAVDEVIHGMGFKGFRGSFNAFGRYFLINESISLNVGSTPGVANELWTGANPFGSHPVLHWNLARAEQVSIRLMDVTGKVVYSKDTRLDAGSNKLELTSSAALAPGTYVLQVVRPAAVFTRQLVKQ